MAGTTPIYGLPYPQSSDLVSAYPALGQDLAEDLDGILAAKANYLRQTATPTGAYNTIWEDTNTTPSVLKIWNGSAWVSFSGAGILTAADVSGTTGSPTISTYTDGGIGYTVYKFTGSGSITLGRAGLCDVLLIGGGGGGGGGVGGGGGAGSFLSVTGAYLPSGAQTVVVGAGGAGRSFGSTDIGMPGNNGIASSLWSFYAPAGGGGGAIAYSYSSSGYSSAGLNGGSGGGAGGFGTGSTASSGAGISGLGNAGGTAATYLGGGGGGANAAGANASSTGGAGGSGKASSITGSSVTYAGGGGGGGTGGAGGTGGGGNGATSSNGTVAQSGTANTGGGGGGGAGTGTTFNGGNGGSGIVIVRVRS